MAKRTRASKRTKLVLPLVLVLLLALGAVALGPRLSGLIFGPPDFSGPGTGNVQIEIIQGDSIAKIGNVLKDAGVVKSVDAFTSAAAANPDSKKIAPGFYNMLLQMKAKDAVIRLLDPTSKVVTRVVVPEGKNAKEIFALLSEKTGISVSDFEAVASDPSGLPLPEYAENRIEGFLFPATYEFPPGTTALSALTAMVDKFNSVSKQINLEQKATAVGKTTYEALIVASLLEGEGIPADFAKVARVVYNRLSVPMPLEFDSTVNYGLGRENVLLSRDQLAQDTPYNTYKNLGLTPTPINNPGLAALEAAVNPEPGDWIFFITTNLSTRETKFTADYNQFLVWKDELLAYCKLNPETCYGK